MKPIPVKRDVPLYPILLAAFPVLSVYSANLDIVPLRDLWRPLGIALIFGLLTWCVALAIFRSTARSAAASALAIASTFGYSRLAVLSPWPANYNQTVLCWAILTAAAAVGVARDWKHTAPINWLVGLMVLLAMGQIGFGVAKARALEIRVSTAAAGARAFSSRPDIFYIILDGFGRTDALQRTLQFDDRFFVNGLRNRGFYVADESRSNYCQTELSISSSLNMDFIQRLLPNIGPDTEDRQSLERLINDNAVERFLRARGYKIVSVTTGFPPIQFTEADIRMEGNNGLTLLESTLLQMTPIAASEGALDSMFSVRRQKLLDAYKNLAELSAPTAQPRLILTHILAPHPPFVFGPNGEYVRQKGPYGFWDASDYMTYVGGPAYYAKGYSGQAEFIGKLTLHAVDQILGAGGPRPIVIIQGDHGSKQRLDQNSLEKTDVTECFQNLSTFLVPDSIRRSLYPGLTPVNSFRIVLHALFDANLPLLPDKSWYSTYPHPFKFYDVTEAAKKQGPPKWPATVTR